MKETRDFLQSIGMPRGDRYDLPDSEKRFPDGAQYRFEVPGIQGPKAMKALLETIDDYGFYIHRVTQTKGIMMLLDEEIEDMVRLAEKYQVQLVLAIGPRATYDTSASVHTEEGKRIGYRLRGQEQIVRAVEDVCRECDDIGIRNRRGDDACRDETGILSEVDPERRTDMMRNLLETDIVDVVRIVDRRIDDDFWPAFLREEIHGIEVEGFLVRGNAEVHPMEIETVARAVFFLAPVERKNRVPFLRQSEEYDTRSRCKTAESYDSMVGAKEFCSAAAGHFLEARVVMLRVVVDDFVAEYAAFQVGAER